jgi:hypothetical protein
VSELSHFVHEINRTRCRLRLFTFEPSDYRGAFQEFKRIKVYCHFLLFSFIYITNILKKKRG